jgi:transposase
MKTEKRQVYTAEFKREAVRLVTHQGYGVSEAARNLGINTNMLGRWKRQVEAQETGAVAGNGRRSPEQEELEQLRKENKRLRMERDILKKTVSFFASELN